MCCTYGTAGRNTNINGVTVGGIQQRFALDPAKGLTIYDLNIAPTGQPFTYIKVTAPYKGESDCR
jgi:hypothetical protein